MPETSLEHVAQMAESLSFEDQLSLVERLARGLRTRGSAPHRKPQSLRGRWRGKFPDGINLDAALREVRSEWLEELEEMNGKGAEQQPR